MPNLTKFTIMNRETFSFGEIVLLQFPFTDTLSAKKRPALVLKDTEDGDVIVCRITSKMYNSGYDVAVDDWKKSGLKLPSVIRLHKIAALETDRVHSILGEISGDQKSTCQTLPQSLF